MSMERGRILIVGGSKESTYEIRNLLDHRRFELEIALTPDVGKAVLAERWMNLLIIHTDLLDERCAKLFEYMADKDLEIPIMVVGEDAKKFREVFNSRKEVAYFEKPYPVQDMLNFIHAV